MNVMRGILRGFSTSRRNQAIDSRQFNLSHAFIMRNRRVMKFRSAPLFSRRSGRSCLVGIASAAVLGTLLPVMPGNNAWALTDGGESIRECQQANWYRNLFGAASLACTDTMMINEAGKWSGVDTNPVTSSPLNSKSVGPCADAATSAPEAHESMWEDPDGKLYRLIQYHTDARSSAVFKVQFPWDLDGVKIAVSGGGSAGTYWPGVPGQVTAVEDQTLTRGTTLHVFLGAGGDQRCDAGVPGRGEDSFLMKEQDVQDVPLLSAHGGRGLFASQPGDATLGNRDPDWVIGWDCRETVPGENQSNGHCNAADPESHISAGGNPKSEDDVRHQGLGDGGSLTIAIPDSQIPFQYPFQRTINGVDYVYEWYGGSTNMDLQLDIAQGSRVDFLMVAGGAGGSQERGGSPGRTGVCSLTYKGDSYLMHIGAGGMPTSPGESGDGAPGGETYVQANSGERCSSASPGLPGADPRVDIAQFFGNGFGSAQSLNLSQAFGCPGADAQIRMLSDVSLPYPRECTAIKNRLIQADDSQNTPFVGLPGLDGIGQGGGGSPTELATPAGRGGDGGVFVRYKREAWENQPSFALSKSLADQYNNLISWYPASLKEFSPNPLFTQAKWDAASRLVASTREGGIPRNKILPFAAPHNYFNRCDMRTAMGGDLKPSRWDNTDAGLPAIVVSLFDPTYKDALACGEATDHDAMVSFLDEDGKSFQGQDLPDQLVNNVRVWPGEDVKLLALPESLVHRGHRTFIGWSASNDPRVTLVPGDTIQVDADIVFTAVFQDHQNLSWHGFKQSSHDIRTNRHDSGPKLEGRAANSASQSPRPNTIGSQSLHELRFAATQTDEITTPVVQATGMRFSAARASLARGVTSAYSAMRSAGTRMYCRVSGFCADFKTKRMTLVGAAIYSAYGIAVSSIPMFSLMMLSPNFDLDSAGKVIAAYYTLMAVFGLVVPMWAGNNRFVWRVQHFLWGYFWAAYQGQDMSDEPEPLPDPVTAPGSPPSNPPPWGPMFWRRYGRALTAAAPQIGLTWTFFGTLFNLGDKARFDHLGLTTAGTFNDRRALVSDDWPIEIRDRKVAVRYSGISCKSNSFGLRAQPQGVGFKVSVLMGSKWTEPVMVRVPQEKVDPIGPWSAEMTLPIVMDPTALGSNPNFGRVVPNSRTNQIRSIRFSGAFVCMTKPVNPATEASSLWMEWLVGQTVQVDVEPNGTNWGRRAPDLVNATAMAN